MQHNILSPSWKFYRKDAGFPAWIHYSKPHSSIKQNAVKLRSQRADMLSFTQSYYVNSLIKQSSTFCKIYEFEFSVVHCVLFHFILNHSSISMIQIILYQLRIYTTRFVKALICENKA